MYIYIYKELTISKTFGESVLWQCFEIAVSFMVILFGQDLLHETGELFSRSQVLDIVLKQVGGDWEAEEVVKHFSLLPEEDTSETQFTLMLGSVARKKIITNEGLVTHKWGIAWLNRVGQLRQCRILHKCEHGRREDTDEAVCISQSYAAYE